MKSFIAPSYTFTPGASGVGTVDLSGISGFNVKYLVSIINQTRGVVIYATASASQKYTNVTGSVVTLFYDTSSHSGSDVLQVIYESQDNLNVNATISGVATSAKQDTGNTSLSSIDGKLTGIATSAKQDTGNSTLSSINSALAGTLSVNTGLSQGLTDSQLRSSAVPVSGTVSVSSTVLPTGAATSAKQDDIKASIDAIKVTESDFDYTGTVDSVTALIISTEEKGTLTFNVTGTWVGTIIVEGSLDGTTYLPTTYVALTSGNSAGSFTANTSGQVNTVGLDFIRFRGNTISSGTANFVVTVSRQVSNVMLDNPLPTGSNNIGSINNVTGTVSLPTGASTAAKQDIGNTSLSSIDGKVTGVSTSAKQDIGNASLSSVDSKIPSGLTVTSGRLQVDAVASASPNSDALMMETISVLKQIANPITTETATGRMRVVLDTVGGAQTLGTVTTVTTVTTLSNITSIGAISASTLVLDAMSTAWGSCIRGRIS